MRQAADELKRLKGCLGVRPCYLFILDCWWLEGATHLCPEAFTQKEKVERGTSPTCTRWKLVDKESPGARPLVRDVGCFLGHSLPPTESEEGPPGWALSPAGSNSYQQERRPPSVGTDTNNQHAYPPSTNNLLQPRCKSSS